MTSVRTVAREWRAGFFLPEATQEVVVMNTVDAIEEAIRKLPDEDPATPRAWFAEFDAAAWDRRFEEDVADGRLEAPAEVALRDGREGRCTDL